MFSLFKAATEPEDWKEKVFNDSLTRLTNKIDEQTKIVRVSKIIPFNSISLKAIEILNAVECYILFGIKLKR